MVVQSAIKKINLSQLRLCQNKHFVTTTYSHFEPSMEKTKSGGSTYFPERYRRDQKSGYKNFGLFIFGIGSMYTLVNLLFLGQSQSCGAIKSSLIIS
jgi:hypothetical protein